MLLIKFDSYIMNRRNHKEQKRHLIAQYKSSKKDNKNILIIWLTFVSGDVMSLLLYLAIFWRRWCHLVAGLIWLEASSCTDVFQCHLYSLEILVVLFCPVTLIRICNHFNNVIFNKFFFIISYPFLNIFLVGRLTSGHLF